MKTQEIEQPKKKQSKAGEWLDAHPGGIIEVLDWRAVLK